MLNVDHFYLDFQYTSRYIMSSENRIGQTLYTDVYGTNTDLNLLVICTNSYLLLLLSNSISDNNYVALFIRVANVT